MTVDALVQRFIPLDDGTGDHVFDTWTNKVAKNRRCWRYCRPAPAAMTSSATRNGSSAAPITLDQVGFDPSGNDDEIAS